MDTYDQTPALATLSNGTIGIVWVRTLYNDQFQFNSNMFFAVLAADGSVTVPPIRLTNNATWGTWNDLNVPRFNVPRIAGTDDRCRGLRQTCASWEAASSTLFSGFRPDLMDTNTQ